jgi:vacuolar-type H+-ATPase subunit I/STV1
MGMSSVDLFGVVVRTLGLWFVVDGLGRLAVMPVIPAPPPTAGRVVESATSAGMRLGLVNGLFHLSIGLILFFAANWIVSLAYRATAGGRRPPTLPPGPP